MLVTCTLVRALTLSHSILLEKVADPWFGRVYSFLSKELTEWLSAESDGECSLIQLAAGHEWCSPGLSFGSGLV